MEDDILDLRIGRDHDDDDFGARADVGGAVDDIDARIHRALRRHRGHVIAGDGEALVHHVPRHLIAHGAQADDAGVFHAHS